MTANVRIVKGEDSAITLQGAVIASSELEWDGGRIQLDSVGNTVIMAEELIARVPVPKVLNAVLECTLVINGTERIPCQVVANPLRPRL